MDYAVLILAGGQGRRFDTPLAKQYHLLKGRPLLSWAVESFADCADIDFIQIVIRQGDEARYHKATEGFDLPAPVVGGRSRQESVFNGLKALESHKPRYVFIHDAARPIVPQDVIYRLIDKLTDFRAVIPYLSVKNTIKERVGHHHLRTLRRDDLISVQTPQAFDFQTILAAHKNAPAGSSAFDDASMLEKTIPIALVEGSRRSLKITTLEDIALLEFYLSLL